jgi:conjugative transfer signal peptidase TraF
VKRLLISIILVFFVAPPFTVWALQLHINYTDSIPVGLYRETHAPNAGYIGFCLTPDVLGRAHLAGLMIDPGDCPGNVQPVLKPLYVATPEHPLRLDEHGFVLDGNTLFNTAPKAYSQTGVALQHYPFGVFTGGVWAISTFNPDSFDSRYFGPLDPASIRFRAKPFWTK